MCGAVVVEELRTSLLVEEGVRERWTLEGLGGGRMEQGEVLDRFNLKQKTRTRYNVFVYTYMLSKSKY